MESHIQPEPALPQDILHYSRDLISLLEAERHRVARELHDSVNQLLSSVHFRLQIIEAHVADKEPDAWRETLKAMAIVEKAIQEVRRISHNLRPSELDDLGLAAAVRGLCKEFADRTGLALQVTCSSPSLQGKSDLDLNLYRIIQEALANIEKHAHAKQVAVTLAQKENCLELTIRDDGRGFAPGQLMVPKGSKPGMGLLDMRERAAFIGGTYSLKSAPGHGTEIHIQVPLP